jgi:hypothetical protein
MPKKLVFETPVKRRLDLPTEISSPVVSDSKRDRKPLFVDNPQELTHQRVERPRTLTDVLIDRVRDRDQSIDPARLRGRIDMLLQARNETVIQWGEANLTPLQKASNIQAKISAELQRIDATTFLNEAKDAAMGNSRGLFGMFPKKPDDYERKLTIVKSDLMKLMMNTESEYRAFVPEVSDLNLDSSALGVVIGEYTDSILLNIANSRLKTLLLAHQTGTMLLTVLENTIQQCAQSIEQIDSMLSVTIPQWKLSKA